MVNKKIAGSIAALVALSTLVAGCGANNNTTNNTTNTSGSGTTSTFKVGLVTDVGGLNDHGFNHLADEGLNRAESQLHISGSVAQSQSESDYVPLLTNAARQGNNLVIAVGFAMHDAVESVSKQFPNTKFMIIDDEITDRSNVQSSLFNTEQCGYLVGALAGLIQKQHALKNLNNKNVFGVVQGADAPPVNSYIAGFQQGVKATDPAVTVKVINANSFTDQALGSTIANNLIAAGADIIFPVAGAVGVGSIQAAQKAGVYAIGVDADQGYLSPNVITSATKGVDTSVFDAIQNTMNGKFSSGDVYYNLKNSGVGFAKPVSSIPSSIVSTVNGYAKQIMNNSIKVSATMQK